jgi:hypothetical protein
VWWRIGLITGRMCVERRGAPGRPTRACGGSRWVGWAAPWAVREWRKGEGKGAAGRAGLDF